MEKKVNIRCLNNCTTVSVPIGSTLLDIYKALDLNMPYEVTSAKVNNRVEGLHYTVYHNKDVEFLDITHPSGQRTYLRSLLFVLHKTICDLFPGGTFTICAPVCGGYYCRLDLRREVVQEDVSDIRRHMKDLVKQNLPFLHTTSSTDNAITLFRAKGMEDKAQLLETYGRIYTNYYTLDDTHDYYYGSLLVNTSQLKLFEVEFYNEGLLLRLPDPANPNRLRPRVEQEKMLDVFREYHQWQKILGVNTVGELNRATANGHARDLIHVSEALQEKKISQLADRIANDPNIKIILISGPSSSGKTTFSLRLSVQLMACGRKPVPISLDDYFVDRHLTPRDANGDYDYECIDALNIPLLSAHLQLLLAGKEVELPRYNFLTGKSEPSGKRLSMNEDTILILEGIHALNPILTDQVSEPCKFKIYVSALTTILLDNHNYIPTTDNRLLRRIVRDNKYRGYSALETIRRWPSVRAGEEKWIFPYQEKADVMFNSALLFELAALRDQVIPLLEEVDEREPEYSEASRLLTFLSYLRPMPFDGLPPTSLLREFLGGSTFSY